MKCSIIIPTYNRENVIQRAIDSSLKQSYNNIEIIVIDDCSSDNTENIVREYNDNRLLYSSHTQNRGANAARNTGVREASGDLISFLDSDDELTSSYIQQVVESFEKNVAGIFTSVQPVAIDDEYNNPQPEPLIPDFETYDELVMGNNPIGGFTASTFRADVFDEIGLLDESLESFQDLDFFMRFFEKYDHDIIKEPLALKYAHSDQIGRNHSAQIQGRERFFTKHGDLFSPAAKYYNYRQLYYLHRENKNYVNSVKHAALAAWCRYKRA